MRTALRASSGQTGLSGLSGMVGRGSIYAAAVLADAPAGYWRLGEPSGTVAVDASGNGRTGTYAGGVTLAQPGALVGDPNTAALFNGTSGHVTILADAAFNTPSFSVEAWIKPTTAVGDIMHKNGATRWRFFLENSPALRVQLDGLPADVGNVLAYGLVAGSWAHVVGTYDHPTTTWRIYLNGVLQDTQVATFDNTVSSALDIGQSNAAGYLACPLDEVGVYATALSAARVLAHYHAGIGLDLVVTGWSTASLGASPPWSRMSRDGLSWDSGRSFVQDARGSWIGAVIDDTGPQANWTFSSDGGLTFATSGAIDGGFLVRASLAYDGVNDMVYALWEGSANTDGIFLRRYQITRTTPGNLTTAIASIATTRDATLNLVMDAFTTSGTVLYGGPQLLLLTDNLASFPSGSLLCVWSVGQTGAAVNGGEVRASLRRLSNSAADNTAANWLAPAAAGTKLITQGPTAGLPWSQLWATSTFATHIDASGAPFGVVARPASGTRALDLHVAYFDGATDAYRMARFAWRGTPNWDFAGAVTRFTLAPHLGGADPDAGYDLKQELTSQISHDAVGDRLYLGVATWAGDTTLGDRWTLVEVSLTGSDAVATATVYAATKALSAITIFVTGAVYFDPIARAVLATYSDLSAKLAWSRTYNRTTPATGAAVYAATPVDIPCILPWRDANGKAVVLFRDFNAGAVAIPPAAPTYTAPYQGFVARGTWS